MSPWTECWTECCGLKIPDQAISMYYHVPVKQWSAHDRHLLARQADALFVAVGRQLPKSAQQVTDVFSDVDAQLARYGQEARHDGVEVAEWHRGLMISRMASARGQCVCWRLGRLTKGGVEWCECASVVFVASEWRASVALLRREKRLRAGLLAATWLVLVAARNVLVKMEGAPRASNWTVPYGTHLCT